MRCPRCNAMVEDSALVCPECGLQFSETEPLIQAETEDFSAEEPEVFSDTPVDAVSEEEQPAYPEEQLPPISNEIEPEAEEESAPVLSRRARAEAAEAAKREKREKKPKKSKKVAREPRRKRKKEPQTLSRIEQKEIDAKRKKRNRKRAWLIIVGLILVLGLLFFFANNYVQSHYDSWSQMLRLEFGIGSMPTPEKATVEAITNADGKSARKITVKGTSPDVLLVKSLENQRVTFVNGVATITVPDSYFIPKEITTTETAYPISLDMVILDNRGNEVQVPCDTFTIDIPQAQASEINPPTDNYETSEPNITLSFKCSADSTIYLNGEKRSEDISGGSFSLSLPLNMGENTFDLEVRAPYSAVNKHHFVINRVLPAASIAFNGPIGQRTTEARPRLDGKFEPGATVSVVSGKGRLSVDNKNYTFTYICDLSELGDHSFVLKASKAGLRDGELKFTIERIPDSTSYVKKCKDADAAQVVNNPKSFVGKALCFNGTVQAMENQKVTIGFASGQTMVFTYKGATQYAVGDKVKVYGQLLSANDDKSYDARAFFIMK